MSRFRRISFFVALGLLAFGADAALAYEKSAGPIWNNWDAQGKCPAVCAPGTWDGNWNTVASGMDSVCSCHRPNPSGWTPSWSPSANSWRARIKQVAAGPIWNNEDAQGKCARACGGPNMWDGNWRTVGIGQSTCDCYSRW